MTALSHYERAHAIELTFPSKEEEADVGHFRWPLYTDGGRPSKAYFVKYGPRPHRRVIASDMLCVAHLFYAWETIENGTAWQRLQELEKLGWKPAIVEVTAATSKPNYQRGTRTS